VRAFIYLTIIVAVVLTWAVAFINLIGGTIT
jgi:hypothetical protein